MVVVMTMITCSGDRRRSLIGIVTPPRHKITEDTVFINTSVLNVRVLIITM